MTVWLQFEGIRCFSTPQSARIRPLTILVGENSSGKSTFLALCQIASALAGGTKELPFNQAPFLLGAYDQIASWRGGRAGRAKSFSVGLSLTEDRRGGTFVAEFFPEAGQPSLCKWSLRKGNTHLNGTFNRPDTASFLETHRGTMILPDFATFHPMFLGIPVKYWYPDGEASALERLLSGAEHKELEIAWELFRTSFGTGTYALAPIRSSPQRTYDPVSAIAKPEGSHVPMLLASMLDSERAALWSAMREFGFGSGLFDQIEVNRKGRKESDPFQIGIRSGGPSVNLVDVGYGVSQVLPIIVDALQGAASNQTLLLQQPEVHLHPRAQAELGSFFVRLANKKRRFIVETHSDYLVDRVRREVREGRLRPDDVSLLYFERGQHGSTVHNLDLDKGGSIENPPESYRQFFLDEERQLLGV